jgi:glyoxylase-like metal-dependent hydrolase (beta-lactamase superfamily II)
MSTGKWSYTRGLHDLGNGTWAYLQPDGSWVWSNAGMVTDGNDSLLVDTLFDLRLTREMLLAMRSAAPRATASIDLLVNTHSNGDHCNGNELIGAREIIASKAAAEEMRHESPAILAAAMRNSAAMGPPGEFFRRIFGPFDFEGITQTLPTSTFEGTSERKVGAKTVRLIQVGPAHTRGDVLVHVPADRTVFTGDILFIGGHPIAWAGPVSSWINACQRILDMDVETIVPGHGPITDKLGVAAVKSYLEDVSREARRRFDSGLSSFEAAKDIARSNFPKSSYSSWTDGERIAVTVATLYREFTGDKSPPDVIALFAEMASLASR